MREDGMIKPELPHDHRLCLDEALIAAERLCAARGARLTETRRRVLALVWSGHKAVKAYDLLEHLAKDTGSARPPTVYRALDFLLAQGLIHRIESLNAYIGCPVPGDAHASQFLVCRSCATVIEMTGRGIAGIVRREAMEQDFLVERQTVEVHGLCSNCRSV